MNRKIFFAGFFLLVLSAFILIQEEKPKVTDNKDSEKEAVCNLKKDVSRSVAAQERKEELVMSLEAGESFALHHESLETQVETPLGKMVLTTFSQKGIPIQGMRIRRVIKKDGSSKVLENTYRSIPEVKIPEDSQVDNLFIYVGRNQNTGELAFSYQNQIIRLSDRQILKQTHAREERKPVSLHPKGFGD